MINLRITGLYNRGQQDEYVELEAAARCDLEGLMLVRYLYNAEGFPIYSQARLYEFPDTNLRKGTEFVFIQVSPKKRKFVRKRPKTDLVIWERRCNFVASNFKRK